MAQRDESWRTSWAEGAKDATADLWLDLAESRTVQDAMRANHDQEQRMKKEREHKALEEMKMKPAESPLSQETYKTTSGKKYSSLEALLADSHMGTVGHFGDKAEKQVKTDHRLIDGKLFRLGFAKSPLTSKLADLVALAPSHSEPK